MKEPRRSLLWLSLPVRQKTGAPNNNNNSASTYHVRCQSGTFEGLLAVYVVQGSSAHGDAGEQSTGVMP